MTPRGERYNSRMAKANEATNPFYVILLVAGVLFFLTASTYFVMTLRQDRIGRQTQGIVQTSGLMEFMDQRGGQLLAAELVLLAACTAAAMASDGYWSRRQQRKAEENHS
jgi:hypothetical protein